MSNLQRWNALRCMAAMLGMLIAAGGWSILAADAPPAGKPNVLWIVSEDNNPFIGAYGDKLARTPTIDRLAAQGVLYENCTSNAPVCAPARFTIITGMYATSCGPAHHMRAQGNIPVFLQGYPAYLRQAGYYCTNNAKTDYNSPIKIPATWDECGRRAHWRNRPAGKPFFAVFNHEITHESQLFPQKYGKFPPLADPTDPAKVILPAYHPDTPEFRQDRANYYDQMRRLDAQVAALLKQLDDDGLSEDTIVFYYGDNGGILPRSKRFCYETGLHVPLIIRFPKKYRNLAPSDPGTRIASPVGFVDLAPTMLSLAGVPIPKYMQGHALAGEQKAPPQEFSFGFRGRMDCRYDNSRSVRDVRYRYIRNYMPHLIYAQHIPYMFQMRSLQVWEKLHQQGKLQGPQNRFWETKPEEELYDLQADPDEINNLVNSPQHQEILVRMRQANENHILQTRDNGFIPEGSPLEGYDPSQDRKAYPLERILPLANLATKRDPANLPKLIESLADENECMRYWAALGCVMLADKAGPAADALAARLQDLSPHVQVAAAEALCHIGQEAKGVPALAQLLRHQKSPVKLQAANALENIGPKATPALPALEIAAHDPERYVHDAAAHTVAVLKGTYHPGEKANEKTVD